MRFKKIDVTASQEQSNETAELFRQAGIRLKQRVRTEPARRPLYVISVHPDDADRAEEIQQQAENHKREEFFRTLKLVRKRFSAKNMLITREPNEDGYYLSRAHHGEPFDETQFRLERGGWDHEHCYLCWERIFPGDEWWTAHPPNLENELGLCLKCHRRLFDVDPS